MLKDKDIREPLIQRIHNQNTGMDYRIIPEMVVCDGQARIDVAVANGKLYGYEIKSDADNLDRLPLQQDCYNKTFDRIYIVVGEKFKEQIFSAVPHWWGVYVASSNRKGTVVLRERRKAKRNPHIETQALLELLWADEIRVLLNSNGIKGVSKKNRRILRTIAISNLSLDVIREYTRERLKQRLAWREEP